MTCRDIKPARFNPCPSVMLQLYHPSIDGEIHLKVHWW